jgi:hypothetical protein
MQSRSSWLGIGFAVAGLIVLGIILAAVAIVALVAWIVMRMPIWTGC